jgi:hypothetical protein
VQDKDEYSTDLMKCIEEVEKQEKELSIEVSTSSRKVYPGADSASSCHCC